MYGMKKEHTGYGHTGAGSSLSSLNMRHGEDEREFDNFIYGSDEKDENVYDSSAGFNEQESGSPPDYEFDNVIYGYEGDEVDPENGYSLVSAPLSSVYDTVTNNVRSESDGNVNDECLHEISSEQVYYGVD